MSDIDFQPDQIELNPLNASLVHYNVSPVVKGRRSKEQLKRKLTVKSKELMNNMKINCDEQSSEEKKNSDSMKDLMKKVKEKFFKEKTKYEFKIRLLTLAPKHWSIEKTKEEFQKSSRDYLANAFNKNLFVLPTCSK